MAGQPYIGCMGWQQKDWVGSLYPEATKPADMLALYARTFSSAEVDTTFYGRPRESTVDTWREAVSDEFRFTLKVPREVTHRRRFEDAEQVFTLFVDRVRQLGTRLGAILIQCPREFSPTPANRQRLYSFLDAMLPPDINVALELRHPGWFDEALFEMARSQRFALAATEGPHSSLELAERILVEQRDELDFAYIRLMGLTEFERYDRVQADRAESLDVWARIIHEAQNRVRDVYIAVSDDYAGYSPATVDDLASRLRASEQG